MVLVGDFAIAQRIRLQELNRKLPRAAVIESSDDATISETLDGTITLWNRAAEKHFCCFSSSIPLGKPTRMLLSALEQSRQADDLAYSWQDILRSYELGANCYVSKPGNSQEFISAVTSIGEFWFGLARLPREEE
jgi:PAS domain-containing protein